MWSVLKKDLFEFVTTVQTEASQTLTQVIQPDEETEEETEERELAADAGRAAKIEENNKRTLELELQENLATYTEGITGVHAKEGEVFVRNYRLSSNATEIARLLRNEVVSNYYSELVPSRLTAEEFWGRYFFKKQLLFSPAIPTLEDDDEELTWDANEEMDDTLDSQAATTTATAAAAESQVLSSPSTTGPIKPSVSSANAASQSSATTQFGTAQESSSAEENAELKNLVASLERQMEHLRQAVVEKDNLIATLSQQLKSRELKIEEQRTVIDHLKSVYQHSMDSASESTLVAEKATDSSLRSSVARDLAVSGHVEAKQTSKGSLSSKDSGKEEEHPKAAIGKRDVSSTSESNEDDDYNMMSEGMITGNESSSIDIISPREVAQIRKTVEASGSGTQDDEEDEEEEEEDWESSW